MDCHRCGLTQIVNNQLPMRLMDRGKTSLQADVSLVDLRQNTAGTLGYLTK
jgi:hypothetical protein